MEIKKYFDTHKELKKYTNNGVPLFKSSYITQNKLSIFDIDLNTSNIKNIDLNFNIMLCKKLPKFIVDNDSAKSLLTTKNKINKYRRTFYKFIRLTNPYELVDANKSRHSVLNINVLNRAYFKMWEILTHFGDNLSDNPITYVALAEGPGGFIQSVTNKRNTIDSVYAITLPNHHDMNFSRKVISDQNIDITYGDITDTSCIIDFVNKVPQKAELITADGGMGIPDKLQNYQEVCHLRLFFCEILMALALQKVGGMFIIKMYDLFTLSSLQLLYILSLHYKYVHITKPITSRPANSEKYIVCLDFKGIKDTTLKKMYKSVEVIQKEANGYFIHSLIDNSVPQDIVNFVTKYHYVAISRQIRHINRTLYLADKFNVSDDVSLRNLFERTQQNAISSQKQFAIQWAKKHNVPVKKKYEKELN